MLNQYLKTLAKRTFIWAIEFTALSAFLLFLAWLYMTTLAERGW